MTQTQTHYPQDRRAGGGSIPFILASPQGPPSNPILVHSSWNSKEMLSPEEESKPTRPTRPLPTGPASRVQQAASAFASGTPPVAISTPQTTTPTVFRVSTANHAANPPVHTKVAAPPVPKIKDSTVPSAPPSKAPLSPRTPGHSHSFFMPKSPAMTSETTPSGRPNSISQKMGHTMSYGTLGLPRPKPPGSPPPVPITSSSSEYDNSTQEDNTPIPHAKSAPSTLPTPAQNHPTEDVQSLAQQLKEVKDRLTRQVHEITVLKRELDDKYRIELELKTDLEMERSKEKEVKIKPPPPEGKKPPPPSVPPPPQHLQLSHSGTNLSTHQLNNQILELKATITILEKENLMIREELDKSENKAKEDAQTVKDLRAEMQGLRREMTSLRTQLESMPQASTKTYEATFDFVPENEGDLGLRIGDLIQVLEEENDSWWRGINLASNLTGIFPSNFIKEVSVGITEELIIDDATPARMVRALFDYNTSAEDEISFKKGDMIELLIENDNGWWYGVNPQGQTGLFPSNFAAEE